MIKRTELMEQILTSEQAQIYIDKVSPIYGNAYVFLNIFNAIGQVLDDLVNLSSEELRKQLFPQTVTWAIDLWEKNYNIESDTSLTIEERRKRLLSVIQDNFTYGIMTPERLSKLVANLTGYETNIVERITPTTFKLKLKGFIPVGDPLLYKIYLLVKENVPANLTYEISMSEQMECYVPYYNAVAVTGFSEKIENIEVIN